jgi:uncharacterized protein YyaL (SSP411 family)
MIALSCMEFSSARRAERRLQMNQRLAVEWREWSREAFEEARSSNKLVLLDLSAEWCHWCHVMDETTYSNAEIIRIINRSFIPVRVDIDRRPDISERYNRGGFPTTAFLSDQGEHLWGATYVPPEDMKRVLKAMLEAKEKGDVDGALAQQRMQYLDLSKSLERQEKVDAEFVDAIFEDVFAAYDAEWGGFGIEPKFPHDDGVDLLLERYASTRDEELSGAVRSTLDHMTAGLYDEAEGGVFRYSVRRDWKLPHFEKMLDTNLGFLRNLARARTILGDERYAETARGVAEYLLCTLRDTKTGAFFSSQDADEEYYKVDRELRAGRPSPKVIEEVFSGLNCRAVSVLIETGILLDQIDWIEAARSAWGFVMREQWDDASGLVGHSSSEPLFLFDDQVDFLEALIAVAETQSDLDAQRTLQLGERLIKAVDREFSHPDGGYGDIRKEPGAIGKLADPERSLAANSRWARALALHGAATHDPERTKQAWDILRSFPPKRIQANGIFASHYIYAWDTLQVGLQTVEIHAVHGELRTNPLWTTAKKALNPGIVVLAARKPVFEVQSPKPFAVICGDTGCSKEILEPEELAGRLWPSARVKSKYSPPS